MIDYELSSQCGGWTYCLWPEMRILPTWSKWKLAIWWLRFQLHRLFTSLWDTEISKLCNIETPKRVIFSLIYLATYDWFSYLLMSVALSVRKTEPKHLCRDWYSSDLLFPSVAASPFLRQELWLQELGCTSLGPHSAELGARTCRVCSATDLSRRRAHGTSCTNVHSHFAEDIGLLQPKVVAFCQEALRSLSAAFCGQLLMPCQRSDVASCFQIVDITHLRSNLGQHTGRAAGEIVCIHRSNFIYLSH